MLIFFSVPSSSDAVTIDENFFTGRLERHRGAYHEFFWEHLISLRERKRKKRARGVWEKDAYVKESVVGREAEFTGPKDGWDIRGGTVRNMISFTYETHSLCLFCFIVTFFNVIILLGDEEIAQSARFTGTKLK